MQFCPEPGCGVLVPRGRCPTHALAQEHARPNRIVRRWYHTQRWVHLRAQVLVEACYTCAHCGVVSLHLEVDHIVKHEGDPLRFWDHTNLQALCAPCHTKKTNREMGRYGSILGRS